MIDTATTPIALVIRKTTSARFIGTVIVRLSPATA